MHLATSILLVGVTIGLVAAANPAEKLCNGSTQKATKKSPSPAYLKVNGIGAAVNVGVYYTVDCAEMKVLSCKRSTVHIDGEWAAGEQTISLDGKTSNTATVTLTLNSNSNKDANSKKDSKNDAKNKQNTKNVRTKECTTTCYDDAEATMDCVD